MITLKEILKKIFPDIILREAGIYTIINGIASLFPFLLIPLITRYIEPSDYGIYAIFLVGINLLMPLIGIGSETAAGRKYVDKEKINYPSYISTAITLTIVLSIIVLLTLNFLAPTLNTLLPIPKEWYPKWIAVAWAQTIIGLILVINQMNHKPFHFGIWRIGRALILNLLFLLLIILNLTNWENLLNIVVVTHLSLAFFGIVWLFKIKLINLSFSKIHLVHIIQYGLPLVPHMLAAAIITATDRIILNSFLNERAVGIYTIGYQAGLIMFIVSQSINRAWTPWFYEKLKNNSHIDNINSIKTLYKLILLFIIISFLLCLAGWIFLPFLFGSMYLKSVNVFYWIVIAFLTQGLWSLFSSYLYYTGETIWISLSSMTAAIMNIGISIILVINFGLIGAALGTFIAYLIALIILLIITIKKAPLPWLLNKTR